MKINKLYKLSQFVDIVAAHSNIFYYEWTCSEIVSEARSLDVTISSLIAIYISDYNNFLKQDIKEEMLFNKLEKPSHEENLLSDGDKLKAWEKEEKKVIFKNARMKNVGFGAREAKVKLRGRSVRLGYVSNEGFLSNYSTIEDLANATNGEIDINIEL